MFPYQPASDVNTLGGSTPSSKGLTSQKEEQELSSSSNDDFKPRTHRNYVYPTTMNRKEEPITEAENAMIPETFSQISSITESHIATGTTTSHHTIGQPSVGPNSIVDWQILNGITEYSQIAIHDEIIRQINNKENSNLDWKSRWALRKQPRPQSNQQQQQQGNLQSQPLSKSISRNHRKRRLLWIGLAFVVLVVVVVVVSTLCGTGTCGVSSDKSTRSIPTSRADAIVSFINSITLTGRTLRYPTTGHMDVIAEEKSLQWLIDEDWNKTSVMDWTALRQRYVLVTILFLLQNNTTTSTTTTTIATTAIRDTTWVTLAFDECDWLHVDCVDGEVTRVFFKGLSGPIPSDLGLLTALTYLDLQSNHLTGTIPSSLGLLTKLTGLYLDRNQLTGTIPSTMGSSLTNLNGLWLFNNDLTGSVPFCDNNNNPNRFRSFGLYTGLRVDCDQVVCPCCTGCCPVGGWQGIPQGSTPCDAE